MKIFVGSLPYETGDEELKELFEAHGEVTSAKVIMDRETGRSRGFGFVEMTSEDDAQKAMEALDGSSVGSRTIVAKKAQERERR